MDYTTLFSRLGKLTKACNRYKAEGSTALPAELASIVGAYSTQPQLVTSLYDDYVGFQDEVIARRQQIADYAERTLTDRSSVLSPLGVQSSSVEDVLAALAHSMTLDAQTIKRSTVTLGTVAAASGNVGNGTIVVTKTLDGVTPPTFTGRACLEYAGKSSELAVTETMTVECTGDSGRDGLTAGSEQFRWYGAYSSGQRLDWAVNGSGEGPTLTAIGSASLPTNGSFDAFTANVPDGWTIDNGAAGTHVYGETTTTYRGGSALRLTGDGATATIGIGTAVDVQARKAYCVTLRWRSSAVPAAGSFLVQFEGTGYVAATSEKVSVAAGAFPTTWTLASFVVVVPASVPADLKIVVRVTGTLSNGVSVYVDDLSVSEVTYHGGVGAIVVPGSTPFVIGDRFTVAVANDQAGVFQEFFRDAFGVQLPSSATPTIADTLAT